MAFQQFQDGGFTGKLGQLIGQGWRNKRIVKTYAVPSNPRTPAQMANRNLHTIATRLAMQAYNINKGHPSWQSIDMLEFSARISVAKRRLQNGATEAQALPLFPDGYNPGITLTDTSAYWYNTTMIDIGFKVPSSVPNGSYTGVFIVNYLARSPVVWRSDTLSNVTFTFSGTSQVYVRLTVNDWAIMASPFWVEGAFYLDGVQTNPPLIFNRVTVGDVTDYTFTNISHDSVLPNGNLVLNCTEPKASTDVRSFPYTLHAKNSSSGTWVTQSYSNYSWNPATDPSHLIFPTPAYDFSAGYWIDGYAYVSFITPGDIFRLPRFTFGTPQARRPDKQLELNL